MFSSKPGSHDSKYRRSTPGIHYVFSFMIDAQLVSQHKPRGLVMTRSERHLGCDDDLKRKFLFDLVKVGPDKDLVIHHNWLDIFLPILIPVFFLHFAIQQQE